MLGHTLHAHQGLCISLLLAFTVERQFILASWRRASMHHVDATLHACLHPGESPPYPEHIVLHVWLQLHLYSLYDARPPVCRHCWKMILLTTSQRP